MKIRQLQLNKRIGFLVLAVIGLITALSLFSVSANQKLAKILAVPVVDVWVVPHHDLVHKKIDEFWKTRFSNTRSEYSYIVLIGPDHNDVGNTLFSTNNEELAAYSETIFLDQEAVLDHSIQVHYPFIDKYMLPQIIEIAIRSDAQLEDIQAVQEDITEYISASEVKSVLIVASVDFAHVMNAEIAEYNDGETLAAIQAKDFYTLLEYDGDNLDSDQSVVLATIIGEQYGRYYWVEHWHGNSAMYTLDPNGVTSYFVLEMQ